MLLSAVIITKNESAGIVRCIQSLAGVADEVLVVDSESTDDTRELAAGLGARVIMQPFLGFGRQKAFAIAQASHDWVLSVDADEEATPALRQSLLDFKAGPGGEAGAYTIHRLTNYCGHWVRHCGWYPEQRTLLFDRRRGLMSEAPVHEGWQPAEGAVAGHLRGDLLHYSYPTVASHFQKIEQYTTLGAALDYQRGKRAPLLKMVLGPAWKFFSMFILKLGFLDGYHGWLICRNSAFAAWVKYAKLRELARGASD